MAFVGGDSWESVPLGLNSSCFFRLWALRDSRWIPVIFLSLALQWSAVPELREMPGTLPAVPGHQAQCFFDMFRLPFQLLWDSEQIETQHEARHAAHRLTGSVRSCMQVT